jgi:hypothetical protein
VPFGGAVSRKILLLACVLVWLPVHARAAEKELCTKLRNFRTTPFEKDARGKPLRRVVEFHFVGNWLDLDNGWTRECRPGGNAAARVLCPALMNNSNAEFREILPEEILTCYGWKMPVGINGWSIERAEIELNTDEKGKSLGDNAGHEVVLEIDYRFRKREHEAVRLSVIPWGEDSAIPHHRLNVDEPNNPVVEEDYVP